MGTDLLPAVFGVVGTLVGAGVSGGLTWLLSKSAQHADHARWLRDQRASAYIEALDFLMRNRQTPDLLQIEQTWSLSARLNVLGSPQTADAFHTLAELPAGDERNAAVRALRPLIRNDLGSDQGSH
jgi:hypothetical protein